MMKKYLLVLVTACISFCVSAQNQNPQSQSLQLTNHKLVPEGIHLDFEKDEPAEGKIYRIVQNAAITLDFKNGQMEALEYLPKNAFVMSIVASEAMEARRQLLQLGATAIVKIEPEWKLSKNLFNENIPEWAWLDNGSFKLWVRYHADLQHDWVSGKLHNEGYIIIDEDTRENVIALAVQPDMVKQIAALPYLIHLQEMEDPGEPENYTARSNHRVNVLQASYPGAVNYDGTGVVVGLGDDGALGDHIDYTGRLTQSAGNSTGDHGDHVAGTIFGAGNRNPKARGMAPGAEIYYESYPSNLHSADGNFINQNVRITSSSYSNGCNAGYTNYTRQMDQDALDSPELIHVFSAGNNGNSNCGYGAGSGWGNVTGGHKIAKNVIAVANLNLIDNLANSSSRGPASDGRIKPDISAVGTQVFSTTDLPSPNSYTQKTGTSMSCPGVSGTLATLYQAFRANNSGQDPHGGLLKAIALNSADDIGNPGPDYRFGYGRINARKAHNIIASGNFITSSISSGNNTHNLPVPSGNVRQVKIMLYWPDAPASTIAAYALVNDLDLTVSQGTNTYAPWVLDPTPNPSNLNSDAVRARDSLNNMEQVTIENPGSGNITIDVAAFSTPAGQQEYFIVYEFVMDEVVPTYPVGGEGFNPGQTEYVRWDATEGSTPFTLEYSADSGTTWTLISSSISPADRYFSWSVPNTPTNVALTRIIRGQDTAVSPGTFVISNTPANFAVESNCPDSVVLSWDPVPNVTGYAIYRLGNKYMDSITYTTNTSVAIPQSSVAQDDWYAIAPVINGKAGQRSVAIQTPDRITNCPYPYDLFVSDLISPVSGGATTCFPSSGLPVKVELKNIGKNEIYNFPVSYSFNSGSIVTDTVTDTIGPGETIIYTFSSSSINLTVGNTYNLDVWIDFSQDANNANDTLESSLNVLSGTVKNIPYFNDFEGFNLCNTSSNCGGTTCNLNDGWNNAANGLIDDIDFRTNSGTTPSQNTGPFSDYNPGTTTGRYIYLEASNCDSSEAILTSPCLFIDSASIQPMVEFGYHLFGFDMGRLNVDLITDSGLVKTVVPEKAGYIGNFWSIEQIDLSAYIGQHVTIRFRGKTGEGYRSDLALDDFRFFDAGIAEPIAEVTSMDSIACVLDTIIFNDQSSGAVDEYEWDFGAGAAPATASTAGPHHVVYATTGIKTVSLKVSNGGGSDQTTYDIPVKEEPVADFSFSINQNEVNFTDASSFDPTNWLWDFGDGDTSSAASPLHIYSAIGSYYVSLSVENECGTDTYSDSVTVDNISGMKDPALAAITIFPNPTPGKLSLNIPQEVNLEEVKLMDLNGKLIRLYTEESFQQGSLKMDISRLPDGVYLISVNTDSGKQNFRVIKQN